MFQVWVKLHQGGEKAWYKDRQERDGKKECGGKCEKKRVEEEKIKAEKREMSGNKWTQNVRVEVSGINKERFVG